jgi:hypothetical protein
VSDNINKDRWQKFIGVVAASGICALTRSSIGPICKDPDIEPLIEEAMQEVIVVGRAAGIDLDSQAAAPWRSLFANVPDSGLRRWLSIWRLAIGLSSLGWPVKSWNWANSLACQRR